MEDPRVEYVANALLRHHLPNKFPSEADPGARERARSDATVMLAALDELRRSDQNANSNSLAARDVERITSAVRSRTLDDAISTLRGQIEASQATGHAHLNHGLRWGIAVLTGKKQLPEDG